jgi:hypothetical protein
MSNIQKTLDALQPYVIGIRYLDGLPVVDAVFKDGWTVPDSDIIKKVKGDEGLNYYMIFSEKDGIGLDELLNYVDITIKANVERENKHELLKEKVNELKEVFKKTSLEKLKRLKYCFDDENLVPDLNDFNLDEPIIPEKEIETPVDSLIENDNLKENKEEYSMTDEDAEILEEEMRAENFRKMQEARKINGQMQKISQKIELPPKNKHSEELVPVLAGQCECGPDEACSICIENKDL